jgi:hypothetical protein
VSEPLRTRFDVEALNPDDPFEIDMGNRPHLFKHGLSEEDLLDVWWGDPVYFPSSMSSSADWLLVGPVPGNVHLCSPLAPANSGRIDQCRPIGLYRASMALTMDYQMVIMGEGE